MKGRMGDNARIHHILECINKIESAISGFTYEDFERNDIYRTAVVKWLEIIGRQQDILLMKPKKNTQILSGQVLLVLGM